MDTLTRLATQLGSYVENLDTGHRILLAAIAVAYFSTRYAQSPWRKLPPGPRGVPLLGNIFQLGKEQWITFTNWRIEHGDVIYLNLAGQPVIVMNSLKAAADILDRMSEWTSDRPRYIVPSELMSGKMFMGFSPYGPVWRGMRRASHEALHKKNMPDYHPIQAKEALILTADMLTAQKEWDDHLQRATTSVMGSLVYDAPTVKRGEDSLAVINEFNTNLTLAALPGTYFVESIPWLKHVPSIFAAWKRKALASFAKDSVMLQGLAAEVKTRVDAGDNRPSFVASLIRHSERNGLSELQNAWLAGSVYAAGATTHTAMTWFVHAMAAYPHIQKRAQAEVDAVVGRDRLPSFSDFEKMPYVRALIKEVLRWRPVAPVGSPHRSMKDFFYEGHFIPAGSVLISNIWSINHDPAIFGVDAAAFNPERYLDESGNLKPAPYDTKEEHQLSYGFGRRICPGRYFANDSLFIDITTILWAMTITPAQPGPVDMDRIIDEGVVVRPADLDCKFTPRAPGVLQALDDALKGYDYER